MWVGSERRTLWASANEELGTLADNTPAHRAQRRGAVRRHLEDVHQRVEQIREQTRHSEE